MDNQVTELTEGEFTIPKGYEFSGIKDGKIIINKIPEIEKYTIIRTSANHMGMLDHYQSDGRASFLIDFSYSINPFNDIDVNYIYTKRSNICCEYYEIIEKDSDDYQLFMDIINGCGHDIDQYNNVIKYTPKNNNFGIFIEEGEFKPIALQRSDIIYSNILGGMYKTYKYDTYRACKISCYNLYKKVLRCQ